MLKNSEKQKKVYSQDSVTTLKPWVLLQLSADQNWITRGPYSVAEVKEQLRSGLTKATDYCWKKGFKDWVQIYLEQEFYLSRKPPIEISSVRYDKQSSRKNIKKNHDSKFKTSYADVPNKISEIAYKMFPLQYKGWKFKKTLKDRGALSMSEPEVKKADGGVLNMLEPWDSTEQDKVRDLDFLDRVSVDLDREKTQVTANSENFPKDIGFESEEPKIKNKFKSPTKVFLWFGVFALISISAYRIYKVLNTENLIDYNMSYFVVEDYLNELPEYMYARTDLKKTEQIKIRVFNLSNVQIRTKAGKAGILLTSKGTGRMRIPMYAYKLSPGSYKLVVEIQDQRLQKEFIVAEPKLINKSQLDSSL